MSCRARREGGRARRRATRSAEENPRALREGAVAGSDHAAASMRPVTPVPKEAGVPMAQRSDADAVNAVVKAGLLM